MAEENKIRLKDVMKEFNLGYGTIKDFLKGKSLEVDNPNARIPADAYQWIAKEFGNELLVKKQAQEIDMRRPKDTIGASAPKAAETAAATPIDIPQAPQPAPTPAPAPPVHQAIKIVGKIELATNKSDAEIREEAKLKKEKEREKEKKKQHKSDAQTKRIEEESQQQLEEQRESKRIKKAQKAAEEQEKIAKGHAIIDALLGRNKEKTKKEEPAVDAPIAPNPAEVVKPVIPSMPLPKITGKIDLDKIEEKETKRENWIGDDERERERKKEKNARQKERKKRAAAKKEAERQEAERLAASKKKKPASKSAKPAPAPPLSDAERTAAAKEKLSSIYGKKDKNRHDNQEPTTTERKAAEFITTDVPTLSAPKVLDKIDLSAIKGTRPESASTPASSQQGIQRGKRKRIFKTAVASTFKKDGKPSGSKNDKKGPHSGKPSGRKKKRPVVNEEEVQKKLKETLAKMMEKGSKTRASKYRRDKRDAASDKLMAERQKQVVEMKTLELTEFVTANDLSKMMDAPINSVIDACMNLGLMVSLNQRLDAEAIALIVENFGYKASFVAPETQSIEQEEEDSPESLKPRAPIVTVMGHVDHGKTSLIDNIRKTNIIAGEAGGITQHIGAYHVDLPNGRQITFLDTPGHEAFTAMRARGAQATDVAIIIVAADDSVMPQTIEAINHAVAAGVPMIFAINKVDKPGAAPDKIREQLAAMNFLVEDWGGKYQVQEIAAKQGMNVDKLLEKILVETDLLELKANPDRRAKGVVIESLLDKGRGYISRVLVQNGTLHNGDVILSGQHVGKVKAMFNERGKKIKEAGPSIPVEILGLNGATTAGDTFLVMADERQARSIASQREQLQRLQGLRTQKHITLDEIGRRIAIGNFKELNIIVKADVDGSKEALTDSLLKLSTEQVQVNVIHSGVGAISESDVQLAIATESIIVCFQVRPSPAVRKMAEQEGIDIRLYSIIYDAIDEIKDAIAGMHTPEYKESIVCVVEVMQVYHIAKVGCVAGCIVRDGKVTRQTKIRLIRAGIVIHTGRLESLKRFKDDAKEVLSGFECGLSIAGFSDIEVGDFIEGYEEVEVE
jgi:translation initiation factor IF-2